MCIRYVLVCSDANILPRMVSKRCCHSHFYFRISISDYSLWCLRGCKVLERRVCQCYAPMLKFYRACSQNAIIVSTGIFIPGYPFLATRGTGDLAWLLSVKAAWRVALCLCGSSEIGRAPVTGWNWFSHLNTLGRTLTQPYIPFLSVDCVLVCVCLAVYVCVRLWVAGFELQWAKPGCAWRRRWCSPCRPVLSSAR